MFRFAMWSWARLADAGRPNSGDVSLESGRGGQGSDLGVPIVRFVAPSAAAGIAGDRDLRLWLLGGGELRCGLEEGAGWWSGDRRG
jgi:hypothetical protein